MAYQPKTSITPETPLIGAEKSRERMDRQIDAKAARIASEKATALLNKKTEEPKIQLPTRGIHARFQRHGDVLSLKDAEFELSKLHISQPAKEQMRSDLRRDAEYSKKHDPKLKRLAVRKKQWDTSVMERKKNMRDAVSLQEVKTIQKESGHIEDAK